MAMGAALANVSPCRRKAEVQYLQQDEIGQMRFDSLRATMDGWVEQGHGGGGG